MVLLRGLPQQRQYIRWKHTTKWRAWLFWEHSAHYSTQSLLLFLSHVLSLFLCPSTSYSFSFTNMHTFTHSFSPPPSFFSFRQSLWFQQAHMHGAGSTPPSISPLLLFCIAIRVTNACLVPYWIRLMSLLTAFSLRQTCNEEEMRAGLLINRPTFHHASQVAGWTLCWCWCLKPVKVWEGCVCAVRVYGRKNWRIRVMRVLPNASPLPPPELAVT